MEAGAAQFDSEGFTVEAQQLRDQADSLREQAATARAGETGQDLDAEIVSGNLAPSGQQTVVAATESAADFQMPVQVFPDVENGRWSEKDIALCKEKGVMSGRGDGNFHPTDALTREEAAAIAARIIRLMP